MNRFLGATAVAVLFAFVGFAAPSGAGPVSRPAGGHAPKGAKPVPNVKQPAKRPASGVSKSGQHGHGHGEWGTRDRRESRRDRYDSRLMDMIENAESLDQLRAIVIDAARSRNLEVRMAMIDALEEKGRRTVNELAAFIADPDEEVSDAAWNAWSSVVGDMDDRGARLRAIHAAGFLLQNVR